MIRVIVFLLAILAAATGLAWLADRPGNLVINWQGYEVQTTVFQAIVILALFVVLAVVAWSILRGVWQMPAGVGNFFNRRREKRGLEALSSGMIAIGAGDKSLATRYAVQARKSLPNEPLTHILRAQAAQLSGDRSTSRRIFEAMLASPDTEPLGLRGLFLEAEREGEAEAAKQFAERALKLNPKLSWPVHSLFDMQCKGGDWSGALETLAIAKKHGHIEKPQADRRRAVLLTAKAQIAEDTDPESAMKLAEEAHSLAPDLVPATAIAGRLNAARGNVKKSAKILQAGWRKKPHPDIATAYAYARIGDSPKDRLSRIKQLTALSPHSAESPIAVATAAIEAKDYQTARSALEPMIDGRLSQRICTLMAKIESEDGGNTGAVREWLARAVNAPRDPAWTADGVVADEWAPVSPVTGALDAFEWRVPVEVAQPRDAALLTEKIEELVALGARPELASDATPSPETATTVAAAAAAAAVSAVQELATDEDADGSRTDTGAPVKADAPATKTPASEASPVRDAEDAEVIEAAPPAAKEVQPTPSPQTAGSTTETSDDAGAPEKSAAKTKIVRDLAKAPEPAKTETPQEAQPAQQDATPAPAATQETSSETSKEPPSADAAKPGAQTDGPQKSAATESRTPEDPKVATAASSSDDDKTDRGDGPPPTSPTKSANGAGSREPSPAGASATGSSNRPEPAVFVSPRPPDDPGPVAEDEPATVTPSPAYAGPRRKY